MESIKIKRENEINTLFDIIQNREKYKENSENGLVILLNGSWGSGKTTFINDISRAVNTSEEYELFTIYNSYEYDFYDNAYIPFFASIEDKLKLGKDFCKLAKPTGTVLLSTAYSVINSISKNKAGIDLNDIINNAMEIQNESYLKDYNEFKKCKEKIKKRLNNYCKKKPQIIIIDELDRCKPSFAMETLEIIKHFFDIKDCIFIISVDKLQLQESAKTIYGQEMDSERYFSKFFDYQHNLLPLNFNEIVNTNEVEYLKEIVNRSTTLFNGLNISSRDSKKVFNEFVKKYQYYNVDENEKWTAEQSLFIIFLLTLKYTDLLFYNEILRGNYGGFKSKINSLHDPVSNNYKRIIGIQFAEHNIDYILNTLTRSISVEFLDKNLLYVHSFISDADFNHKQSVARELIAYIPQIGKNYTYKQTLELLIG